MLTTCKSGDKGEAVRALQRALASLAYAIKIDGDYGPITVRTVMDYQRSNALAINGDANEATVQSLSRKVPAEMPAAVVISDDALKLAGERALAEAVRMWCLDIYDPRVADVTENAKRCKAIITDIIVRNGWRWKLLENGGDGTYHGNGPPQWCGMFGGDCWREAGLDAAWLPHHWASTARLACWFNYRPFNEHSSGARPAVGARMYLKLQRGLMPRFPDGTLPRKGDVVIVGDGDPKDGDHVTLLEDITIAPRVVFHTISGNGGGVGPTGKPREGVSRHDFMIDSGGYRAMFVGRPGVNDLLVGA